MARKKEADLPLHPSDSRAQSSRIEAIFLNAVSEKLHNDMNRPGIKLVKATLKFDDGSGSVEIDGVAEDVSPPILVEIFSRLSPSKGSVDDKLATDVLKFLLIKLKCQKYKDAQCYLVKAENSVVKIAGWRKEAAKEFKIELLSVKIPEEIEQELRRDIAPKQALGMAQKRISK